jgi:hypothetical protein
MMAATRKKARVADSVPNVGNVRPLGVTADTLMNFMTGMGTEKDKGTATMFGFAEMPREQLEAAYRGDWISRKIVDIPAYDATREWRSWEVDKNDGTKIYDVEMALGIQRKAMLAMQRARLYGGAALVIGVDQGKAEEPLDVERIKQGSLKFVHVVNRHELTAGQTEWDVNSPYFGEPQYYTRSLQSSGSLRLHPSRVVRFMGLEPPDLSLNQGWGDSVLQSVADAVMSAGTVTNAIAALVNEAKIDIVKIPELSERISNKAYEDRLKSRFAMANMMKSLYSLLLIDKEEEWSRVQQTFVGMPEILQMYLLLASGAADIPATRFLSQSPAGMNATGESDTRNYYDRVSTEQNITVTPALSRLDDVLLMSALGTKPDGIFYEWNPLWQLDEVQKATIAVQKSQVLQADVTAGLLNSMVLQKARENQLIEDGTYPGLEQIIEEFGDDIDEREEEAGPTDPRLDPEDPAYDPAFAASEAARIAGETADPAAVPAPANENEPPVAKKKKKAAFGDAQAMADRIRLADASRPRTLYMRRDVLNQKEIKAWAKSQGFDTTLDDMHVTIIYSKTAVDWLAIGDQWGGGDDKGNLHVKPGGPRVIEVFGKAVVLAFANTDLQWRWRDAMDRGASSDYEEYTPHVTLTYNVGTVVLDNVVPYRGAIDLGPEIFEEIKTGFNNETDTKES